MHWHLEAVALTILLCIVAYSLLTKVIAKAILTLPILFTGLGYLVSDHVNALAKLGALQAGTRLLAEATLSLVLFSDASHVRFARLRENYAVPTRMLVIGLPLTLGLGTVVTVLINSERGLAYRRRADANGCRTWANSR